MPNSFGGSGLVDWYGLAPTSGLSWNGGLQFYGGALALNLNFTTGTLDSRITFSRGTNATLTDSTGKITYAPNNLLLQSQTFDNASWLKLRSSISADATTAPNGTTTADSLIEDTTASNNHIVYQPISPNPISGVTYIYSVYVKPNGRNWVQLEVFGDRGYNCYFNVSTGTVGTATNATGSMTAVGNGWYRCVVTFTVVSGTSTSAYIFLADANGSRNYTGDGTSGVFLWGAQLEAVTYQTTPSTYVATTASAYYGPRFDYDPVTLACKGLLIEEQRTNFVLRSQDYAAGSWLTNDTPSPTKTNIAPDGTATAYSWALNTAATGYYQLVTVAASTKYTTSIFVKYVSGTAPVIQTGFDGTVWGGGSNTYRAYLNFNPQTYVFSNIQTGVDSYGYQNVGNGWIRVWVTATSNSSATSGYVLNYVSAAGTLASWGAQLEAGSFATSYIPTTTATVTRSADVASMTGSNFSSWYNQSAGTFVSQFDMVGGSTANPSNQIVLSTIIDSSNRHIIYNGSSQITGYTVVGGVDQAYLTMGSLAANIASKMAYAYQVNDFAASKDGGAVSTDTSGSLPSPITLGVGSSGYSTAYLNGHIASIQYYNKRLPNATLQSLTAPSLTPSMSMVFDASSNSYIDANWSP